MNRLCHLLIVAAVAGLSTQADGYELHNGGYSAPHNQQFRGTSMMNGAAFHGASTEFGADASEVYFESGGGHGYHGYGHGYGWHGAPVPNCQGPGYWNWLWGGYCAEQCKCKNKLRRLFSKHGFGHGSSDCHDGGCEACDSCGHEDAVEVHEGPVEMPTELPAA